MVGSVKTGILVLGGDAEHLGNLEDAEDNGGGGAHPGSDDEDTNNLHAELLTTATHQGAVVFRRFAVDAASELLVCEESGGEDTPDTAEEVHGGGVEGVVNLKLEEQLGGAVVHEGTDETDENSGPGVDDGAGTGDGDETCEDTVEGGGDVGGVLEGDVDAEGGGTASARREGGGHGGTGGVAHVLEGEGGDGVEAIPAEPEDEGAEGSEDGGVALHLLNLTGARGEAAGAWAEEDGTHEGSGTTSHVHNTGTSEIDHAVSAHVRLVDPAREETVIAPAPVHDNGVNEAGEGDGVGKVSGESAALGDGALLVCIQGGGR